MHLVLSFYWNAPAAFARGFSDKTVKEKLISLGLGLFHSCILRAIQCSLLCSGIQIVSLLLRTVLACGRGCSMQLGTILPGLICLPFERVCQLLHALWAKRGMLVWGKGEMLWPASGFASGSPWLPISSGVLSSHGIRPSSRILLPLGLEKVQVCQCALSQLAAGWAGTRALSFNVEMLRCHRGGVRSSSPCPPGPGSVPTLSAGRSGVLVESYLSRPPWPRWEWCAVAYAPVLCLARRNMFKKKKPPFMLMKEKIPSEVAA